MTQLTTDAVDVATAKCKDCQFWGRYYEKPGWQGYCIQLAKNKDGLEEACNLWKSDSLSSQS